MKVRCRQNRELMLSGREGHRDVQELKAAYQEKIQSQRKKAIAAIPQSSPTSSPNPLYSTPSPTPPPVADAGSKPLTPIGIQTLSSFIDIPKILQIPHREIEYIWRLRHASNPQSLCAVIPQEAYTRIEATARKHPQFILPLPREGKGAEIHFLQWTFPDPTTATVLLTNLAEFKVRGEYAQPHTVVTHHLDLREEKGLVLLQGNVVEGRGVTVDEGKWLLMCLQKFYGGEGERAERRRLLKEFSEGDVGFRIERLLEEAEKLV